MSLVLRDEEFASLYRETIRELFFHEWYSLIRKDQNFCSDSPVHFYRFIPQKDLLIDRSTREYNPFYAFTKSQTSELEEIYLLDGEGLKRRLREYFPYWQYLIPENSSDRDLIYGIISPEYIELTPEWEDRLSSHKEDLFWQQAYLWALYGTHGDHKNIHTLFQLLIESDPGNPFVLLRYARFLGSSCYKSASQGRYLEEATRYILLAIESLQDDVKLFTFCYSWLGQVCSAGGDFEKAIRYYDQSLRLNQENKFYKEEPYIWKANALTSLGKYTKSQSLYDALLARGFSAKHNDDFRNFKVMAINSWYLSRYDDFRRFFLKSLELLLLDQKELFDITAGKSKFSLGRIHELLQQDTVLRNDFNSFNAYYATRSESLPSHIRVPLLHLGWLYLKQQLKTLNIIFHHSRGLEKLCYYYLQDVIHEK